MRRAGSAGRCRLAAQPRGLVGSVVPRGAPLVSWRAAGGLPPHGADPAGVWGGAVGAAEPRGEVRGSPQRQPCCPSATVQLKQYKTHVFIPKWNKAVRGPRCPAPASRPCLGRPTSPGPSRGVQGPEVLPWHPPGPGESETENHRNGKSQKRGITEMGNHRNGETQERRTTEPDSLRTIVS